MRKPYLLSDIVVREPSGAVSPALKSLLDLPFSIPMIPELTEDELLIIRRGNEALEKAGLRLLGQVINANLVDLKVLVGEIYFGALCAHLLGGGIPMEVSVEEWLRPQRPEGIQFTSTRKC